MTFPRLSRPAFVLLSALAALASIPATAVAQSLRPNIMFLFDTSGSMRDNAAGTTIGEGTNICPAGTGPAAAMTSRIYALKSALRAALAQAGTDEANFGLMSFPQTESMAVTGGTCSLGHYNNTPAQVVATVNRPGTGNHTATGYPAGCLMTSNLANEAAYGAWFTTGAPQVIRVGVTTAAPGVLPVAANFDPPDANIAAIYRWIDNIELPAVGAVAVAGAVTNPELHASGNTPLGRSLFYARNYFDNLVKPADPRGACRQNVVVLITDGADTCDEATAPDATFNLTNCTAGGAYEAFHPVAQACGLFRTSQIKTYMITDSGLPAADLAVADRIAAAGGTTAAIRVSLNDAAAAKAAVVGIIAQTVPPVEICNGIDDNCNGQIDEGVKNMCPLDLTSGTLKHCAVEIPNCLDDNCNGQIDEGFPPNACGKGAGCPIPPEICDGVDNNCDGSVDEGFDVGGTCNNGLTGACRRIGVKECTPDHTGVTCNLTGAPVAQEVCNGIDDDCNGMVDDNLGPGQGVGVDCGIQGQGCNKGVTQCVGGKIVCSSTAQPSPEICNGKDDDCNGLIDDGVFPGVGDSCLCPGLTQAQVDSGGQCRAGKKACKGVLGVVCDGCTLPQAEICNGKDDDCDGVGDNQAMCPSGFGCLQGVCNLLCSPGEFKCPPGYDCVQAYCVPNRCKNVQCGADEKCDSTSGSCVPLCQGITCLSGQTCVRGSCLDCSNSSLMACPTGQLCVNRQCVKDKCAGVQCSDGQYCSSGKCVDLECSPACAQDKGEKCVAGKCQTFSCTGVVCASAEYCDYASGKCMSNLCLAKTCPFCAPATGECTPDPCANVNCPQNGCWTCDKTPSGEPFCKFGDDCGYVKTEAGNKGGGCACDLGAGGSGFADGSGGRSYLFLGLGFLTVVLTKRRRRR